MRDDAVLRRALPLGRGLGRDIFGILRSKAKANLTYSTNKLSIV